MVSDPYILQSFQRIDENLELSLQKLTLVTPQRQDQDQDNDKLQILQEQLCDIKEIVDKVSHSIQSYGSGNVIIDYSTILKVISNLPKSEHTEQEDPLEALVTKSISQYVLLLCYYTLTNESLSLLPGTYDTSRYFRCIADSKWKSLLYSLQTLPIRMQQFGRQIYEKLNKLVKLESPEELYLTKAKNISLDLLDELKPHWNEMMMVRTFRFVGLPKESRKWASFLINLPRAMIRDELHRKLESIDTLNKKYTIKLGHLILEFQSNSDDYQRFNLNKKLDTLQDFLALPKSASLLDVVEHTKNYHATIHNNRIEKPSKLTRYWPTALLIFVYGPSSCIYIWQSRFKILQFFEENVVDFAMGLIYNWVYIPLKQVWGTVRHDEDSSIAVMSKGTLESEVSSLTRMIVSFVNENSGSTVDDNLLVQQVEHGDLTKFMEIYETQLEHPIKNIVTGGLVRSLLIQVQKTKVDGSLALNGIDKMLQSQQLVFGVMAVSPALLILYTVLLCAYRLVKVGNFWSNVQRYKTDLSYSLNNVERILNYTEAENSNLDEKYLNQGLLTIEVSSMGDVGSVLVPHSRLKEWFRDIQEIVDTKLDNKARLNVVNRIYHVYSKYF